MCVLIANIGDCRNTGAPNIYAAISKIVAAAFRNELKNMAVPPASIAGEKGTGSGAALSEDQVTQFTRLLEQMRDLLGLLGPSPTHPQASLILHSKAEGVATAEGSVATLITQIGAGHQALDRIRVAEEKAKQLSQVRSAFHFQCRQNEDKVCLNIFDKYIFANTHIEPTDRNWPQARKPKTGSYRSS